MNDASNIPEFSVSDLSGAIKRALEGNFGRVRVRGEITELKRYPSGHVYFSLKDEGGKIAGIAWKGVASRLSLQLENGVEVVATGKVSAYGERSSYQLIVDGMEYAGAGALLARIEALRLRLAAEGLFEASRRPALPLLPGVVGVVSSAQGAVIQDIRTTIARRFPRRLILWPVPVQGEGAARRIAAAIAGFDALPEPGAAEDRAKAGIPRPDVLIVARGGGSLEDLMAFNDEAVVRAAAACRIPLISAVGHETDTTLIDFVAARRAPTPTAAAEMAVPSRIEVAADLQHKAARLAGALQRAAQNRALALQRAAARLPDLPGLLGAARQRLDDRAARLVLALPNLLAARRTALLRAERTLGDPAALVAARRGALLRVERLLVHPQALLAARRAQLAACLAALDAARQRGLHRRRQAALRISARLTPAPLRAQGREARARLAGTAARLEAVSPMAVLARGYALVTDPAGQPLTAAARVRPGAALLLRFADGTIRATARNRDEGPRQGSLGLG